MLTLGQKLKMPKTCKNHSTKTFELFCAKKRSKKQQTLEKSEDFENQPFCKGFSPWKGYSVCKRLTFGQKLEMSKTCQKITYWTIRMALCKKPLKKHQILKNWDVFENRPSCKGYSLCSKGYSLCKLLTLGQKRKMPKTCQKPFYRNIRIVLWKKRSKNSK